MSHSIKKCVSVLVDEGIWLTITFLACGIVWVLNYPIKVIGGRDMSWLIVIGYFVLLGATLAFMVLKMKGQTRFRLVQVLWCAPFCILVLAAIALFIMGLMMVFRC